MDQQPGSGHRCRSGLRFPLKVVRLVLAWAQEGGSGPRLVADACATPVLRDQGPIGRPGTAKPTQARKEATVRVVNSQRLMGET
jgi:hypothetical protein